MTSGRCGHRSGPASADVLRSEEDVHRFVDLHCLPDTAVGTVGVETEWFVVDRRDPSRPVPPARGRAALGVDVLAGGSRVTFEPGGQLELSSPPLPPAESLAGAAADLARAERALAGDGLRLVGLGADPLRPPRRLLRAPRYDAMAGYFGSGAGPVMMCSTAAVQANLDLGAGAARVSRFRLAHELGPVLLAAFAASPVLAGRVTGWRSSRQAVWAALDGSRTRPVAPLAADPARAWARALLTARLMLVRDAAGGCVPVRDGSTFADWLAGRGPVARPPTRDDLAYHATTLFPPVRPRGWLELRYLDAQPGGGWAVAVAVTTALMDDPRAADAAADACAPVAGRWLTAARCGLSDRGLAGAARACLRVARDALPRLGVDGALGAAVDAFADTYTERGRCPADDLLDRYAAGGPAGLLEEGVAPCPTR